MKNVFRMQRMLNEIRIDAVKDLIDVIRNHGCEYLKIDEADSPALIDSDVLEKMEGLVSINIVEKNGVKPYLVFVGDKNTKVDSDSISVEFLVDILEWIKNNEDEMFGYEDDDYDDDDGWD